MSKKSEIVLDSLVDFINNYKELELLEIGMHLGYQPSDNVSYSLSERRAKAVCDYLIEHKVEAKRLIYVGYEYSKPLIDYGIDSSFSFNINRRIEFLVKRVNPDFVKNKK